MLRMVSLADDAGREPLFEMPLQALETPSGPVAYTQARGFFASNPRTRWAAYVAGVFLVLMRECGAVFPHGANVLIGSEVPEGKGVSSSAAIEVATMQAVAVACGLPLNAVQVAVLCQKVENLVVGAPCGLMDQMTSAYGEAHRLLALLCQPADLQEMVPIPEDVEFWGVDSGIRHSVAGADYGSVRVGAFMGYRIIAARAGLSCTAAQAGVSIEDPRWHGYLANVGPVNYEIRFREHLPERMAGRAFLDGYLGTTDAVTVVDPERVYAVRAPTAHPIYEHSRVCAFARLLAEPHRAEADASATQHRLELLGEMMYQSHASYSACGLGCAGTDRLVALVRQAGPGQGLFGAKITGGGSGGTVVILARRGSAEAIHRVAEIYAGSAGHRPYIFSGSSPGAVEFGHLRLVPES